MTSIWHYWPDSDNYRTACGRVDNTRAPFDLTDEPEDVDCEQCKRSRAFRLATEEQS